MEEPVVLRAYLNQPLFRGRTAAPPSPCPVILEERVSITRVSLGRARAEQKAAWHSHMGSGVLGWGAELTLGPNPSQQVRPSGEEGTGDGLDQGWRKLTKLQSKCPGSRKVDWAWGHARRYRRARTG